MAKTSGKVARDVAFEFFVQDKRPINPKIKALWLNPTKLLTG